VGEVREVCEVPERDAGKPAVEREVHRVPEDVQP
jgi:hypothetical protein